MTATPDSTIQPRRTTNLALSLIISIVIHAALLAVLAAVVIRVVVPEITKPKKGDREIFLTLATSDPSQWQPAVPWTQPSEPSAIQSSAVSSVPVYADPAAASTFDPSAALAPLPGAAVTSSNSGAALKATGPRVSFGGLTQGGQQAQSVVYVVDASGPMASSQPQVFAEVQRSVDALLPTQRFGVVLFRDAGGTRVEEFQPELRDASPRWRAELASWLGKKVAQGRSNPLDGLRRALAYKPQVVFLLSRSITRTQGGQWDRGLDATLTELAELNPRDADTFSRPTVIKTLQFMEKDPTGIMEAIAREHGSGKLASDHRVLSLAELTPRAAGGTGGWTGGMDLPETPKKKPGAR